MRLALFLVGGATNPLLIGAAAISAALAANSALERRTFLGLNLDAITLSQKCAESAIRECLNWVAVTKERTIAIIHGFFHETIIDYWPRSEDRDIVVVPTDARNNRSF